MHVWLLRLCGALLTLLVIHSPTWAEEAEEVVEPTNHTSVYFFGYVKHIVTDPRNNEGNMELFGISREFRYEKWVFDTGVNTYVDSYSERSFTLFSKISYEGFRYGWFTPLLSVGCTNKGKDYDSGERQTYFFPMPMLRVGPQTGFFADVFACPKISGVTNGWVIVELGYKW